MCINMNHNLNHRQETNSHKFGYNFEIEIWLGFWNP